ncbi:MAG: hypothetical protein ACI3Y4_03795 [Candidatus Cryptobacteroides sp.]
MKHTAIKSLMAALFILAASSCGKETPALTPADNDPTAIPGCGDLTLGKLAKIFAELPLEDSHLMEVHNAATSSRVNGYDEEYTLKQLFEAPGCGVGDNPTKALKSGGPALRDLLGEYFRREAATKAGAADAEVLLQALADSDAQIYWPFSEDWDGSYPIITFDPGYGSEYNYGYMVERRNDGLHVVDSVFVDEEVARAHAVWVINTNDDADYVPADYFLPGVERASACPQEVLPCSEGTTLAGFDAAAVPSSIPRQLKFKSITMLRHYDSWFRGASEFWVKCGAVNGFSASTEAELKLYTPSVTDFMVVVPRKYLGKKLEMDSIILTDFTNQLDNLAFLITEDDGGTQSSWKCSATVKVNSKSYGFDVNIPYNEKDDIVWRGQLSASFFQAEDIVSGRFGDVILEFALE